MKSDNKTSIEITKESLRTALLQLLEDQSLHQIKITDLCKRAGVSRMAYYRHYHSIINLYQDIIHHLLEGFLVQSHAYILKGNWQDFWLSFFEYIYDNRYQVKIILSNQEQIEILYYLNRLFAPKIESNNQKQFFHIRGIIGLTYNIMLTWVQSDFSMSTHDLAHLCNQFINTNISGYSLQNFFNPNFSTKKD